MNNIKASVILPTYDEAGHITKLVDAIIQELAKRKIKCEIIIVDDNSPDQTGLLAQKYFAKITNVKIVIRKNERGLSSAIRKGIELAEGEIIVVMDTDFNHEPKLIPTLIEKCSKYDFVIGSRYIKGGGMENKLREKLSHWFNILIRIVLSSPVHDNLSGFFAIKRDELYRINLDRVFVGYGEYFMRLIYLAKLQGLTFVEIPCFYKNRQYGYSKSKFLNMFIDYLNTALSLRFNKQVCDPPDLKS